MEPSGRKAYPTDLTDEQWKILEPLVPAPQPALLPAKHARREIVDAIFYVDRAGCQWRMLPHDFTPWQLVYSYFRRWKNDEKWQRIHDALRRQVRQRAGRTSEPPLRSLTASPRRGLRSRKIAFVSFDRDLVSVAKQVGAKPEVASP